MNKKKILIVDDDKNFTKIVKSHLEGTNRYEVAIENEGKRAFATVSQYKPNLILLDILMPDTDGGEVAQEIKSDQALKNIPVVFLTAVVRKKEIDSQEGIIAGHPFISKSVTLKEFTKRIDEIMGE